MKLSFLGTSYEHSPCLIPAQPLTVYGRFLGSPYPIRRPAPSLPQTVRNFNFKYRGVSY